MKLKNLKDLEKFMGKKKYNKIIKPVLKVLKVDLMAKEIEKCPYYKYFSSSHTSLLMNKTS